ncbi:fasciclin domain-containing protein [Flavobacteriaceae bacterium M23B6Z8]
MKSTFNHSLSVVALFLVTLLTSCSNDNLTSDVMSEEQFTFQESPIISFDEIDQMTQSTIEGELTEDDTESAAKNANDNRGRGISIERRFYDFNAEAVTGPAAGVELEGELNLRFTLFHASFAIFRGNLEFPDGDKARVRGAWISDGILYIIIRLSNGDRIRGFGLVDENGDIVGSFRLRSDSGESLGNWTANLTLAVTPDQDLVDIIAGDDRFTTLVAAASQAELVDALKGEGPLTLFAPTNEAFAALETIPEGETLKNVLLYHVLNGKFRTQKLLNREMIQTLLGEDIKVSLNANNEIVINDSVKLLQANIRAKNGILHVIDAVLIPPSLQNLPSIVEIASGEESLSTLVSALGTAGLVETLQGDGPFTVFAPTNEAFAALETIPEGEALKEVLLYHVASGKFTAADLLEKQTVTTVQGEEVTIEKIEDEVILNGNVRVQTADIMASNGIVHIIKDVLIPPSFLAPGTIVDIAVATPELSTLVSAVTTAGLVETLQGEGPFTVFAPTNDAFAALETIPEGEVLKEVLLYHVAAGAFTAEELLQKQTVTTVQGEEVTIEMRGDKVFLNESIEVAIADIEASNGIIHIIKNVLIPPSFTAPGTIVDIAIATPELSTLVSAVTTAGLVETLQGEGPFTVFAPTNDAFAALEAIPEGEVLKEVLLYHVAAGAFTAEELLQKRTVTTVQGEEVTIEMRDGKVFLNENVQVSLADIEASNGIIHIIKDVLIPPSFNAPGNIVQVAQNTPELSKLVEAVIATDLVDALSGSDKLTVLAPTNAAFEALGTLPEADVLRNVLLLHVIAGEFTLEELFQKHRLTTLAGVDVRFIRGNEHRPDRVRVVGSNSKAEFVVKNVQASNGIVHIIDAVLLSH